MIDDDSTNACCHECSIKYRFDQKVDKGDMLGCWEWTGGSRGNGYGAMKVDGKVVDAHRLSFEIHYGKIGHPHFLVCHNCNNKNCVNPNHLRLDDYKGNLRDVQEAKRVALIDEIISTLAQGQQKKMAA